MGDGIWKENLQKDLRVEISLEIPMIFLSFVNLSTVQRSEQVKQHL